MEKLYTTAEVAQMFEVSNPCVHNWTTTGKLKIGKVAKKKKFYYFRNDIIEFLINLHLGKFKPSSVKVTPALEPLGLTEDDLPLTSRYSGPAYKNSVRVKRNNYDSNRFPAKHFDLSKNLLPDNTLPKRDISYKDALNRREYINHLAKSTNT